MPRIAVDATMTTVPRLVQSIAVGMLLVIVVSGCAVTSTPPALAHTTIPVDPQFAAVSAVAKELRTTSLGSTTWASEWMNASNADHPTLELLLDGRDSAREISIRLLSAGFRAAGGAPDAAAWVRESVTGTQTVTVRPLQPGDAVERHTPQTGASESAAAGKVGIQVLIDVAPPD